MGRQADDQSWTGRWCWTQKHLSRPWNTYAYFRRVIELPDKPQSATLRISADARYTLYVNGRRIHQGPARSFPEHQSYDTLEIAHALEAGKNTLCAIVHQFGVPTFQSVYRDASGLLVDGEIHVGADHLDISTPANWLCREAAAWRKDVARLSVQLGFQEHFDANADEPDWMLPAFDAKAESGWHAPLDIGPAGTHPWLKMEPRNALLLADHIESFKSVSGQFTGENTRGYKVAEDVYRLPLSEKNKKAALLENPDAMLKDDAAVTTITPPGDGNFALAALDLGQLRAGHLILDIAQAAGDEIIDILYTEEAEKNGAPALLAASASEEAPADRYRCRPGPQRWEPFWYKGFRYATLIFRNLSAPLQIRHVALRQVHAAAPPLGSFTCSDERLNQIWSAARETLRNCMFDALVDCPTREQAQWWGDARVQFRTCAYSFGDLTLFERGIRQVSQSQAADGSLHSHPPADFPGHRLPDYMLTWIGTLWDHYFHTGRTELIRQCLPTVQRLLEFFAARESKDGLIGGFDGFRLYLDSADLFKADFSGVLNLMYLQALRQAAALAHMLDEASLAARYAQKSTQLSAAIDKTFWDAKAKVWRDGFDPATNQRVESTSQHMNALAMLLHLRPESHATLARDVLLKPALARKGRILTASPFFYAYILEALAETNFRAEVLEIIREKWGAMLDAGATTFWELWDPQAGQMSRCHAGSSSPLYHISQQVLGVLPVEAGWKQIRIAPLPGKLEFARGDVPTPHGIIHVEWERAGEDQLAVRVDLPPGILAEFITPLGESRVLAAGSHEFHT